MSPQPQTYLYVNTAPKANTRKDGTKFWTVLIGIAKAVLLAKGVTQEQAQSLTVEMQVFPEKVELFTQAFAAAKASGKKLVIKCEEFTLTEVKPNNYIKNGVLVNGFQASCWAKDGILDVVSDTTAVSGALEELLRNIPQTKDDETI